MEGKFVFTLHFDKVCIVVLLASDTGSRNGSNPSDNAKFFALEIRACWEVPSVAHFVATFQKTFGLPDFHVEVTSHIQP